MPTSDDLKQRLNSAATQEHSEFAMALLVSEVIDTHLDAQGTKQQLDALMTPLAKLSSVGVQDLLDCFCRAGFGDRALERVDLSHSNLQWVLAQRQGLPIAVAAIVIEAARRFGLTAYGINFPGHFLVSVQGDVVDPLTLQVLQRQQFAQKLSAHEFDAVMQPTLPRLFGLRMLNNVKIQYAQAENWSEVLDVLACQLLVETVDLQTQAALHFERGDCLQQMSMPSQAERAYKTCLEMSPSDEVLLQAQQRLRDLEYQDKILH